MLARSELAPIGVTTYTRLDHLRRTLDALAANRLAAKSDLYVFSDGPRQGDEEKVAAVREYLSTVSGFNSVNIVCREDNNRIANNRGNMRWLLDRFGTMVFLEEDIVTAPYFLDFMNEGLERYRSRRDIFAICGYTPLIRIPKDYSSEVFLSPRFSAWGIGIWKDRFDSIVFDTDQYRKLLDDPEQLKQFRLGGEDLPGMLQREVDGSLDALDVKIFFTQFVNQQFVVCPTRSLTRNHGHDGTGMHCGATDYFDVTLGEGHVEIDDRVLPDKRIIDELYAFRSRLPRSPFVRTLRRWALPMLDNGLGRMLKSTARRCVRRFKRS